MLQTGARVKLTPLGGGGSAGGRVLDVAGDRIVLGTGRHRWIEEGLEVHCAAPGPDALTTFIADVEQVRTSPRFEVVLGSVRDLASVERRPGTRARTEQPLTWSRLDEQGRLVAGTAGWMLDVSETGLRFETDGVAPAVDEIVAVTFALPDGPYVALAAVQGVNDTDAVQLADRATVRVTFTARQPDQHLRLVGWLAGQRAAAS